MFCQAINIDMVYNSDDFWFNKLISKNFDIIKKECINIVNMGLFVPHDQSEQSYNKRISKLAKNWDAFNFKDCDTWFTEAKKQAPFTYDLLYSIDDIRLQSKGKVYFSMIPAKAEVWPHVSNYKVGDRIRHQLCIEAPQDIKGLYMMINENKHYWEERKVFTFDDAYKHSVKNLTDQRRIVLLYDSI